MKLLIVEDDTGLHAQYKWSIKDFEIFYAFDKKSAIEQIKNNNPEVILLDLGLPPDADNATEGLAILDFVMTHCPGTKVVILTGSEQHEHALKAIELGACDFQQKGIDNELLNVALKRASKLQQLEFEVRKLKENVYEGSSLIGTSRLMQVATREMTKIAPVPVSTLLSGESGTGKELFAKTMHSLSGRKGEFVAINCASIPGELLESELFGHEKGAFTGAHKKKIGKVEQADGGTLFLDEIGDMPMELQSKMLRFLQEREIERVGSTKPIKVDVRVLCATHQDIKSMQTKGTFRSDLYFRLAEFTLKIPALREREHDVVDLANFYLSTYRNELNMTHSHKARAFGRDSISAMLAYDWPGNVRELQNLVKTAIVICETDLISPADLDLTLQKGMMLLPQHDDDGHIQTLSEVRLEAESKAIFRAYKKSGRNVSVAAKILSISRPTFYSMAAKSGLIIK